MRVTRRAHQTNGGGFGGASTATVAAHRADSNLQQQMPQSAFTSSSSSASLQSANNDIQLSNPSLRTASSSASSTTATTKIQSQAAAVVTTTAATTTKTQAAATATNSCNSPLATTVANHNNNNNGPPHYVDLHVSAGECVSLQLLDGQEQVVAGPATITMISQQQTPPVPIPVQVPHGHMIHQIADENGTLKHIILSVMASEKGSTMDSNVIDFPNGSFRVDSLGELVSTGANLIGVSDGNDLHNNNNHHHHHHHHHNQHNHLGNQINKTTNTTTNETEHHNQANHNQQQHNHNRSHQTSPPVLNQHHNATTFYSGVNSLASELNDAGSIEAQAMTSGDTNTETSTSISKVDCVNDKISSGEGVNSNDNNNTNNNNNNNNNNHNLVNGDNDVNKKNIKTIATRSNNDKQSSSYLSSPLGEKATDSESTAAVVQQAHSSPMTAQDPSQAVSIETSQIAYSTDLLNHPLNLEGGENGILTMSAAVVDESSTQPIDYRHSSLMTGNEPTETTPNGMQELDPSMMTASQIIPSTIDGQMYGYPACCCCCYCDPNEAAAAAAAAVAAAAAASGQSATSMVPDSILAQQQPQQQQDVIMMAPIQHDITPNAIGGRGSGRNSANNVSAYSHHHHHHHQSSMMQSGLAQGSQQLGQQQMGPFNHHGHHHSMMPHNKEFGSSNGGKGHQGGGGKGSRGQNPYKQHSKMNHHHDRNHHAYGTHHQQHHHHHSQYSYQAAYNNVASGNGGSGNLQSYHHDNGPYKTNQNPQNLAGPYNKNVYPTYANQVHQQTSHNSMATVVKSSTANSVSSYRSSQVNQDFDPQAAPVRHLRSNEHPMSTSSSRLDDVYQFANSQHHQKRQQHSNNEKSSRQYNSLGMSRGASGNHLLAPPSQQHPPSNGNQSVSGNSSGSVSPMRPTARKQNQQQQHTNNHNKQQPVPQQAPQQLFLQNKRSTAATKRESVERVASTKSDSKSSSPTSIKAKEFQSTIISQEMSSKINKKPLDRESVSTKQQANVISSTTSQQTDNKVQAGSKQSAPGTHSSKKTNSRQMDESAKTDSLFDSTSSSSISAAATSATASTSPPSASTAVATPTSTPATSTPTSAQKKSPKMNVQSLPSDKPQKTSDSSEEIESAVSLNVNASPESPNEDLLVVEAASGQKSESNGEDALVTSVTMRLSQSDNNIKSLDSLASNVAKSTQTTPQKTPLVVKVSEQNTTHASSLVTETIEEPPRPVAAIVKKSKSLDNKKKGSILSGSSKSEQQVRLNSLPQVRVLNLNFISISHNSVALRWSYIPALAEKHGISTLHHHHHHKNQALLDHFVIESSTNKNSDTNSLISPKSVFQGCTMTCRINHLTPDKIYHFRVRRTALVSCSDQEHLAVSEILSVTLPSIQQHNHATSSSSSSTTSSLNVTNSSNGPGGKHKSSAGSNELNGQSSSAKRVNNQASSHQVGVQPTNSNKHHHHHHSNNLQQTLKISNLLKQCRNKFATSMGKLVQNSLSSYSDTKFAGLLLIMFTMFAMLLAIFIQYYIIAPVNE